MTHTRRLARDLMSSLRRAIAHMRLVDKNYTALCNGGVPEYVYLLTFKGNYDRMLFGVYRSKYAAKKAKKRYESSGKCEGGYFDIEQKALGVDLAAGYLPEKKP